MADTDQGSWEDKRQLKVWVSLRGWSSREIWGEISREGGRDRAQSDFQSQKHWPDGKAKNGFRAGSGLNQMQQKHELNLPAKSLETAAGREPGSCW